MRHTPVTVKVAYARYPNSRDELPRTSRFYPGIAPRLLALLICVTTHSIIPVEDDGPVEQGNDGIRGGYSWHTA